MTQTANRCVYIIFTFTPDDRSASPPTRVS